MRPRDQAGITIPEVLVVLVIVGVLASVPLTRCIFKPNAMYRAQMSQALYHMKQLHLATVQMELDGMVARHANLGWPGDTGGTFTNWASQLVPAYLSTNDFGKSLSVAGRTLPPDRVPTANTNGILVYAVSTNSATNAIFLATANITDSPQGAGFATDPKLFGNTGFVVFRKNGDGALLYANQITNAQLVGTWVPLCK
ncbi:hypothetical protein BH09VER1_BH09VER1_44540 [soil metagenome]